MGQLSGLAWPLRAGLLLLLFALGVAACAGIVYWAWQGSLIGVVLSALIPGTLALSILRRGSARRD